MRFRIYCRDHIQDLLGPLLRETGNRPDAGEEEAVAGEEERLRLMVDLARDEREREEMGEVELLTVVAQPGGNVGR